MKISRILLFLFCLFSFAQIQAIGVTLTIDQGKTRPAGLNKAEINLAALLTEINEAQRAGRDISMRNLKMDDFSKTSLARLWATTPFRCNQEKVVDRCWVFKNGTMMVSHVPLVFKPRKGGDGDGHFQEAVVEFDRNGQITDFRFSLSAQMGESMDNCGDVVDVERQHIILQYVERFRTAYNQKDLKYIQDLFSDDALIITGKVVMHKPLSDSQRATLKVSYTRQNKQQYIANLRRAFLRNKWIDVKFYAIGEDGNDLSACNTVTRSRIDPTKYGVRLRQTWKSSQYSDEGYLFLLWEFPEDGGDPIIHVRTWQPQKVGGKQQRPDDNISTLGGFDL